MISSSGFDQFNAQFDGVTQSLNRLNGKPAPDLAADVGKIANQLLDVQRLVEDKTLERMLDIVQDLDEDKLYAEIERAEEALRTHLRSRREAEDTLRAEVERLTVDVNALHQNTAAYSVEASSIHEAQDKVAIARHEEANAAKRQILLCKRNTDYAKKVLVEAQRHAAGMEKCTTETQYLEQLSLVQRARWEAAVEEVNKIAQRVGALEKELAKMQFELDARDASDKAQFMDLRTVNLEVKSMVSEQRALQRELRRAEDAHELQKLMENERAASSKKRLTTSILIQQIAELEESGDQIERHSQAMIEELRIGLERGGTQIRELEHSKRQADEWVKAMWSTICQQKREQLLLHQRMKEEDHWTAHLQERTDALVEELRALEDQVRDYEGPVGATEKEKELEEDMFRRLQKIREKRRGAQHVLAINLARRKPMQEALDDAEEDERVLQEKLKPLRRLMGKDNPF